MKSNEEHVFEYLSGEFNRGYTKAILDIQEIFEYIKSDLKHHGKRLTDKLASDLLKCILENCERVRESQRGFIRWNGKEHRFEFYEPVQKGN